MRAPSLIAACVSLYVTACTSSSFAQTQRPTVYRCADGRSFAVEQGEEHASVTYRGQRFELPRKSSGIGVRYADRGATLVVDEKMAVFVTDRILDLEACREVIE